MEESAAQSNGSLSCGVDVIDMKIEVDLLLLAANWPLRRDVVRGVLDAHDPFIVDHDAVPVVVAVHCAAEQPGPETALGVDVFGVEYDDASNDLHDCASASRWSGAAYWITVRGRGVG